MEPYSLQQIYEAMTGLSDHVVLYLPRTSDLPQLAALVGQGHKVKVIHYCMYGASKVCECIKFCILDQLLTFAGVVRILRPLC